MKKLLIALSLLGMVSTLNAEIIKIVKPTKSHMKELEKQSKIAADWIEPPDYIFSNKGTLAYNPNGEIRVLNEYGSEIGSCFNVEYSVDVIKTIEIAKKVKCPKNLQDKKNR